MNGQYLNKAQFKTETEKCLQCPTKPCMHACPVLCSPHDFIAAAKTGDFTKASELIRTQNPLGEVCGLICPDKFCMKACVRKNLDQSILIPQVQAFIMAQARKNHLSDAITSSNSNGKKIAVIGLGPAGIGAVSELLKYGFEVTAYEKENHVGGALNLIPEQRLPREILQFEWQRLSGNPLLTVKFNHAPDDYAKILKEFDAVVLALGEQKRRVLGIKGEELAIDYTTYLANPEKYKTDGHIMIIGGGAVAVDCAVTAANLGARHVEMLVRRRIGDMRITPLEREALLQNHIDITTMTRLIGLEKDVSHILARTIKTDFDKQGKLVDVAGTEIVRQNISLVILALGSTRSEDLPLNEHIFCAGDYINGGSTAVEAIASGKKAAQNIAKMLLSI